MKRVQSTRVRCSSDSRLHKVAFITENNAVTTVFRDDEDITEAAKRFAAMVRLGRSPGDYGTIIALAALVMTGCEAISRRPGDEHGEVCDLGAWDDIYARWEQVRIVEATMDYWKYRLRREAKARAMEAPQGDPST